MMKPYPEYKDSGIEWIGEIPAHWNIKRLKYLASNDLYSFVDGPFGSDLKNEEYKETGVPLIQLNNIGIGNHILKDLKFITVDKSNQLYKHKIYPGNLVISKMAHPVARAAIVKSDYMEYVIVADCMKLKTSFELVDNGFLVFSMNTDYLRSQAEKNSTGTTRIRIGLSATKKLKVLMPPKEEQIEIKKYLEKKTDKINTLIAGKEKLIGLLREQRAALINHAVTKGLDPHAKMKDSGIPWLGDIPEHWELKKIKHILRKSKSAIKTGPFGSQLKESDLTESGIKIYTQRNILDNNFEKGSDYISQEKFEELNAFEIFPNDILITTRGTIGRCAIFPEKAEKGVMHPCLIRIQIDQELIVNEYLYWYIQESNLFKQNILYNSNPTTIEVIYSDTLKEVKIPVPPLSEQLKIVKNLIVKSKYFDKFISNIHNQINQLKEYRKTLISDAVTGKIDVRGFEP